MAEYRLDELARESGVSTRNIRAYRERGLLDPPRRVGRSAYYDDCHLSQLRTINQLLRRGFNSAHIADFISSVRDGQDLAETLGLRDTTFGKLEPEETVVTELDPDSVEARRLCETGLAEVVDGQVRLTSPAVAEIVARADEQLDYIRAMLHVHDAARPAVDMLAAAAVGALEAVAITRFGADDRATPEVLSTARPVVSDYRSLTCEVVAHLLAVSMRRHLKAVVSNYTAEILLSGHWGATAAVTSDNCSPSAAP